MSEAHLYHEIEKNTTFQNIMQYNHKCHSYQYVCISAAHRLETTYLSLSKKITPPSADHNTIAATHMIVSPRRWRYLSHSLVSYPPPPLPSPQVHLLDTLCLLRTVIWVYIVTRLEASTSTPVRISRDAQCSRGWRAAGREGSGTGCMVTKVEGASRERHMCVIRRTPG